MFENSYNLGALYPRDVVSHGVITAGSYSFVSPLQRLILWQPRNESKRLFQQNLNSDSIKASMHVHYESQ